MLPLMRTHRTASASAAPWGPSNAATGLSSSACLTAARWRGLSIMTGCYTRRSVSCLPIFKEYRPSLFCPAAKSRPHARPRSQPGGGDARLRRVAQVDVGFPHRVADAVADEGQAEALADRGAAASVYGSRLRGCGSCAATCSGVGSGGAASRRRVGLAFARERHSRRNWEALRSRAVTALADMSVPIASLRQPLDVVEVLPAAPQPLECNEPVPRDVEAPAVARRQLAMACLPSPHGWKASSAALRTT